MGRPQALAELVVARDQIVQNALRLHGMRSGTAEERRFHQGRVKNGKVFIALNLGSEWVFAPSKFCGYRDNGLFHLQLLGERHGSDTNKRIISILGHPIAIGMKPHGTLVQLYTAYCRSYGFEPSRHERPPRFWVVSETSIHPDEVTAPTGIAEGAVRVVSVNRFERDPEARRLCLKAHGFDCAVCGFNFEEQYGETGADFIHVHHLKPLSTIGKRYVVDPVNDLIPVCPNCHAMLHRGTDLLTPAQLRRLIQ